MSDTAPGSCPPVQLSPVDNLSPAVQLSSVHGLSPAVELSPVDGLSPALQLSHMDGLSPAVQLSSSLPGLSHAVQLSHVDGLSHAVQLSHVDGLSPVVQLSHVDGLSPAVQLSSVNVSPMNIDCDMSLSNFDQVNFHDMDANTLVDILDIRPSLEDNSKLLGEYDYTDLLPPPSTGSQDRSLGLQTLLDCDGMQYDQPQPMTLHCVQGHQFIEQLVSVCQGTATPSPEMVVGCDSSSEASVTPSSPHGTKRNTKTTRTRRRQNSATTTTRPEKKRRSKTTKKYEIQQSLDDPVAEKKRLNAINSKKNRDQKKQKLQELDEWVKKVTEEKNQLEEEVRQLREREDQLRKEIKTRFGLAFPAL